MTNRKTNSGIGDDLIAQFQRNEDDVTVSEAEPINNEELSIVPIEPEPEDQAINQLLLDIDGQQKQGPDDLPSGLSWANLGFAIIDVPLLREEPIGPSLPPSAASSDSGELPIQDPEDPPAIQQLVTEVLARAGLESSNLVVIFDFTKSNVWTATIHDQDDCNGFEEVLTRYKKIVPHLQLAGLTSFAPIIEMATTIVEQSGDQYHVLLIIADDQVTRNVDKMVDAIVAASKFPLSILLVGVGDGPWDMMKELVDTIPARAFDNFQFVNFTEILSKNVPSSRKETEFALAALTENPPHGQKGNSPQRVPFPPPFYSASSFKSSKPLYGVSSFSSSKSSHELSVPLYCEDNSSSNTSATAPPATSSTYDNQVCPICLTNPKDMAFGCGHQTCCECGQDLQTCPICRSPIQT